MALKVETHSIEALSDGWLLARAEPGAAATRGQWPAAVPGTVGGALMAAGESVDALDAYDWWFVRSFDILPPEDDEEVVLCLDGIATIAEVYIDGVRVLSSPSMFARHSLDLRGVLCRRRTQISVVCRSLAAALKAPRPRPRFRAVGVKDQRLRYLRTTLLGRGLAGGTSCPQVVGPYRPITVVRRRILAVDHWARAAILDGVRGQLEIEAIVRPLGTTKILAASLVALGPTGEHSCEAKLDTLPDSRVRLVAKLELGEVSPWMPHTHGTPNLYSTNVRIVIDGAPEVRIRDVPAGFRSIKQDHSDEGPSLAVCGVPIFCRGAIWTPVDPINCSAPANQIRGRLRILRDAGMNIVRVPGDLMWEEEAFHTACDELGFLVWQDLMLARMDYPTEDPEFAALLTNEVRTELARVGRHPSTVIICGGSEVEQQAAMLGLPPETGRTGFVRDVLPMIATDMCPGLPVFPSSPYGGDLPFRVSKGVSHYFGVGAYLRPLTDARMAGVRFASACLAFANVPEASVLDDMARTNPESAIPGSARWKCGVPRDAGSSWDFEDVRDHYFRLVYDADPDELRRNDPRFYLDLSRMLTGDIMASTLGEWRRAGSQCAGAIVVQAADLWLGSGWGLLDALGTPKPALAILRRMCLPRAVWTTDEGLDGIDIHLANDSDQAFACTLRVAIYRHDGTRVSEAGRDVVAGARQVARFGAEELLGRFVDANWAYRFGPREHELVVVSVHVGSDDNPFLQHFHRVGPVSLRRESVETLGLRGTVEWRAGTLHAVVLAARSCWGVRVHAQGFIADDSWFALEPGRARRVVLRPVRTRPTEPRVIISAVNALGSAIAEIVRRDE